MKPLPKNFDPILYYKHAEARLVRSAVIRDCILIAIGLVGGACLVVAIGAY